MKHALVLLLCTLIGAPAIAENKVIYRGASLIDGTGAPLRPNVAIVTTGERIARVIPSTKLAPTNTRNARIVDASGLYALPGLIDGHVHLASPPNRKLALAMLRRDIYSGITAVRDMAGDTRLLGDLARAARLGEIPSPDIYYAALMAGPEFFHDPRTAESTKGETSGQVPWMRAVAKDTNLPLAIAEAHGTGASAIKIYADLPADLVERIAAEAHRQHMMVWAHAAVFPASPREVIDAGADVVSHVCMLAYQASTHMPVAYHHRPSVKEAEIKKYSPAMQSLFADMKRHGTILDATLYVYDVMWKVPNPQPKPYCRLPLAESLAAQAHRAGLLISTGTDAPADWKSPFPSLYEELELFVHKAGFSPMDAIIASARIGAMTIGREKAMGTIEAGKLANIVFTAKNPLEDIANLQTVVMTLKRGKAYKRIDYRPITKQEAADVP